MKGVLLMTIEKISIQQINPAAYNPRKDLRPGDPEYKKLAKSIDEFDCVEPLIWNKRTGNLVGGHQRIKILIARGDKEVLCSVVDLSPEKEKALNLALNKISGHWDEDKLAVLLDELTQLPDFDISLTGFDLPEISRLIDDILKPNQVCEDDFDFQAELVKISKPKARCGELIKLGSHLLMCGDSTKKQNLDKLLASQVPNMVFTDPPYGIDYAAIKDRAKVKGDTRKELTKLLRAINQIDCSTKYICGHWKSFSQYIEILGLPKTLIVWNKSQQFNGNMKGHNFHLYNPRHEFIYYYGSQKHKAGVYEENVWNISNEVKPDHPTVKPIRLCARAIRNSSNIGDIVLDMFGGSGSTLIACEQLSRRCFMMELDPRYCDVIRKRYEKFTRR